MADVTENFSCLAGRSRLKMYARLFQFEQVMASKRKAKKTKLK